MIADSLPLVVISALMVLDIPEKIILWRRATPHLLDSMSRGGRSDLLPCSAFPPPHRVKRVCK